MHYYSSGKQKDRRLGIVPRRLLYGETLHRFVKRLREPTAHGLRGCFRHSGPDVTPGRISVPCGRSNVIFTSELDARRNSAHSRNPSEAAAARHVWSWTKSSIAPTLLRKATDMQSEWELCSTCGRYRVCMHVEAESCRS